MQKVPQNKKKNLKGRHSENVKTIREKLARTQAELATALGISEKAVQSYEQGWRDVPVRIMIQLLVLLAIQRKKTLDRAPCWEIKDCPDEKKKQCPAFTMGDGLFCWFLAAKPARTKKGEEFEEALPCMSCPVIKRLLKNKPE